jgi:hypothetical protein
VATGSGEGAEIHVVIESIEMIRYSVGKLNPILDNVS